MIELSGGLIFSDGEILVFEQDGELSIPQGEGEHGELSAEAAERISEMMTGVDCEATKYRGGMKTQFEVDEEQAVWQPFVIETPEEAEPNGQWVDPEELSEDEVAEPLDTVLEDVADLA